MPLHLPLRPYSAPRGTHLYQMPPLLSSWHLRSWLPGVGPHYSYIIPFARIRRHFSVINLPEPLQRGKRLAATPSFTVSPRGSPDTPPHTSWASLASQPSSHAPPPSDVFIHQLSALSLLSARVSFLEYRLESHKLTVLIKAMKANYELMQTKSATFSSDLLILDLPPPPTERAFTPLPKKSSSAPFSSPSAYMPN